LINGDTALKKSGNNANIAITRQFYRI